MNNNYLGFLFIYNYFFLLLGAVIFENVFLCVLFGANCVTIFQFLYMNVIGGVLATMIDYSIFILLSKIISKKRIRQWKKHRIFASLSEKTQNNQYKINLFYRLIPYARIPLVIIFSDLNKKNIYMITLCNFLGGMIWTLTFSSIGFLSTFFNIFKTIKDILCF